jgi:hypothetical protein
MEDIYSLAEVALIIVLFVAVEHFGENNGDPEALKRYWMR